MEEFDWNVQNECSLLEAMIGHKPTGINKFFQMLAIFDKFQEKVDKEIMGKVIWSHLETMYNLEALDESEAIPFPNSNVDFELPDMDFAELMEMKVDEKRNLQKGRETPKNVKDSKRDDKTPNRSIKDVQQRRDSKDSRSSSSSRKESKSDKPPKSSKGRSTSTSKDDTPSKGGKLKGEERGRSAKRPTRGSLKPDDGNNSGKSSPVTVGNSGGVKRRRI